MSACAGQKVRRRQGVVYGGMAGDMVKYLPLLAPAFSSKILLLSATDLWRVGILGPLLIEASIKGATGVKLPEVVFEGLGDGIWRGEI